MTDIFLSYASEDRERVRPIVNYLREAGWSVWWDRSVIPGQPWTEAIDTQLGKAKCIIVVWSKFALDSPWVRLEANKGRERKNLVPINIDGTTVPPEFGILQAIEFEDISSQESLELLTSSVRSYVNQQYRIRLITFALLSLLVVAISGVGICTFSDYCGTDFVSSENRSLAILPFNNNIDNPQLSGIADVFIDDLRDTLASVKNQPVASLNAMRALPLNMAPVDVGRRLQVRWLLTGSVSMSAGMLKFSTELIDATTGYLEKGARYQFSMTDLEASRERMARDLLNLIKVGGGKLLPRISSGPNSGEAYVLYLTGKAIIREQHDMARLDEAQRLFDLAVALQPGYMEAEAGLCAVMLWRYESSRSIDDFNAGELHCNQALNLGKRSPDVAVALGMLYLRKGNSQEARSSFATALELDPYSAEAQIGLAEVEKSFGNRTQAEKYLNNAMRSQPGFWHSYNELGILQLENGHVEEANDLFQTAIELSPADSGILTNLGAGYIMSGSLDIAVQALERALSIQEDSSTRLNLGAAYFLSGNYQKAADQYRLAVNMTPDNFRIWSNLADAQKEISAIDESLAYRRALELNSDELKVNPNDIETLVGRAAIYAGLGEFSKAKNTLNKNLPVVAEPGTSFLAAVTYARLGDDDAALTWLDASIAGGFPLFMVVADPAFLHLHSDKKFEMMTTARK